MLHSSHFDHVFKSCVIVAICHHKLAEDTNDFPLANMHVIEMLEIFTDFLSWHPQAKPKIHDEKHNSQAKPCMRKGIRDIRLNNLLAIRAVVAMNVIAGCLRARDEFDVSNISMPDSGLPLQFLFAIRTPRENKLFDEIYPLGNVPCVSFMSFSCANLLGGFLGICFDVQCLAEFSNCLSMLGFVFLKFFFHVFIILFYLFFLLRYPLDIPSQLTVLFSELTVLLLGCHDSNTALTRLPIQCLGT